jgi:4-hydroxy-tetrahydrodipicolinate reductase
MARVPLVLHGATGRMGRAIRACLWEFPDVALAACVSPETDRGDCPDGCAWLTPEALAGAAGLAAMPGDAVVLDVSLAAGTERLVSILERTPRPFLAATTGLPAALEERIAALGARAAVLRAPNLSVGVATLQRMLEAMPAAAREGFVADIVETHHAAKKDAPSGTAIALARALAGGDPSRIRSDAAPSGPRGAGEVRVHSIRAGTEPGTHRILLSGAGESLELTHRAQDRSLFARGALRAARYLHGRAPGRYSFQDVLSAG